MGSLSQLSYKVDQVIINIVSALAFDNIKECRTHLRVCVLIIEVCHH